MSMTGANRTPIGRPGAPAPAVVPKPTGLSLLKPSYLQGSLPQSGGESTQQNFDPQSFSYQSTESYDEYGQEDNNYDDSYSSYNKQSTYKSQPSYDHKSQSSYDHKSQSSYDREEPRDRDRDRDRRDRERDRRGRDRDYGDRDRDYYSSSSKSGSSSRKRDNSSERDRDEKKKKRKSRFGDESEKSFIPGMPTMLPPNLTKEQEEAYLAQLQIEELSRKLRTGDLGIPVNPEERSPSPEPIYDTQGKRLNTREFRTRRKIEEERHRLIERMKIVNPEYKPPADYRPPANKVSDKVMIPQEENPEINFVGLLIGPRGNTLKALEKDTGAKIIIRGKGSVKEGKVGRKDGQPLPGEDEPLHAYITGSTAEAVKKAVDKVKEVIKQGIEVPEGQNDLRRMQLRELALLNGTLRESDIRCSNCGGSDHKSWQCPDKPNVTNNIVCTNCGGAGHIAKDCKAARPGAAGATPFGMGGDKGNIDEEYMSLMAELGEAPPPVKQTGMGGPQGPRRFGTGNLFERQGPMKAIAQGPPPGTPSGPPPAAAHRGPPPSLLDPIGPPPQNDAWRGMRAGGPRARMDEGGAQRPPGAGSQTGPLGARPPMGARPGGPNGPNSGSRFGPPSQRPSGPRGPRPLLGFGSGSEEDTSQNQPAQQKQQQQQYPPMSQSSQSWGQQVQSGAGQNNMGGAPSRPLGVPPPPSSTQSSAPPPPPPSSMMQMGGMGPMAMGQGMGQPQQMMGWGYPGQTPQQWNQSMGQMGMAPNMMQMYGGGWGAYAGVPPPTRPGQPGSMSSDLAAYAQAGLPSVLAPPPPPPPS